METYVRYQGPLAEFEGMLKAKGLRGDVEQFNWWEVWEGLPSGYYFSSHTFDDGQKALKAERHGLYIWVLPNAVMALEKNPKAALIARVYRRSGNLNVPSVDFLPEKKTLEELTAWAEKLNNRNFEKVQAFREEEKAREKRKAADAKKAATQ